MVELRNQIGESVLLAVLDGDRVVVIGSEDAGKGTRLLSKVGVRLPMHAAAAGKAIASYLVSVAIPKATGACWWRHPAD
jgi:DNA-binding IclR family transcriptional regulator